MSQLRFRGQDAPRGPAQRAASRGRDVEPAGGFSELARARCVECMAAFKVVDRIRAGRVDLAREVALWLCAKGYPGGPDGLRLCDPWRRTQLGRWWSGW